VPVVQSLNGAMSWEMVVIGSAAAPLARRTRQHHPPCAAAPTHRTVESSRLTIIVAENVLLAPATDFPTSLIELRPIRGNGIHASRGKSLHSCVATDLRRPDRSRVK
jgi:hypothetical protein